jgi:hypothetical protein
VGSWPFLINLLAEQENTEQLRLLRVLCVKEGIAVNKSREEALEEATQPKNIVRQIDEAVEALEKGRSRKAGKDTP